MWLKSPYEIACEIATEVFLLAHTGALQVRLWLWYDAGVAERFWKPAASRIGL